MLRHIDRVLLRVESLPSAVAYYRDVLGLTLIREDTRVASFQLKDAPTELILHVDPDLPAEGIYYLVDDVRDLYRRRAALKLTFTSPPSPVARGYRATVKDPLGTVLQVLDRTGEQSAGRAVEDAKPSGGGLFVGVEPHVSAKKAALIEIYQKVGRTADDLPYTAHFETLYSGYCPHFAQSPPSRQEVWRHLLNLRKGGKLPRLGDARTEAPDISEEELARLKQMLGPDLGKRDRLPYTDRFEDIINAFNKNQRRPWSPHLIWRVVATLAK